MNYYPITAAQARNFIRLNISNPRIPAGHKWYMVRNLQRYPVGKNVYVIASASGITGVLGVSLRGAA